MLERVSQLYSVHPADLLVYDPEAPRVHQMPRTYAALAGEAGSWLARRTWGYPAMQWRM